MADVGVLKFDVGSPMDLALGRVQEATHATTNSEAFRRRVSIADFFVSERAKGHRIFV